MEQWYWCGEAFCSYYWSQAGFSGMPCYSMYSTGFVMECCSGLTLALALVWNVTAERVRIRRAKRRVLVAQGRSATFMPPSDFEAPDGFTFDPSSGLYYSTASNLYLDPESCHYYDPDSGMWYDTAADTWYEIKD
jgi:hypothetical protein